jgi:uncharacterized protein
MQLDVKNLAFGAVGETDNFDINLADYKLADDIIATSIKGKIKLTRLDNSILAEVTGTAVIDAECDRCLGELKLDIPFKLSQEYFLGGYRDNEDDLLVSKHFEADISIPLQEEIILALPVRRLCQKDCKGLCPHCGADLNQSECKCSKPVSNGV